MAIKRVTFEVIDTHLFDALRRMNGDASDIGDRVIGTMMTGECSFFDKIGMAAYGIKLVSSELAYPAGRAALASHDGGNGHG